MTRHRIAGSVPLLLVAALVGCGSEPPDAPLTVTLEQGGPLMDSPSSFLVEVTRDGDAAPVAASASSAVTVGPDGLVLTTEGLAAGRYTLTAAQVGCGMNGGSCPATRIPRSSTPRRPGRAGRSSRPRPAYRSTSASARAPMINGPTTPTAGS